MWEGLLIFRFRAFEDETRFVIDFGRVQGLVLGGFWRSKNGPDRKNLIFEAIFEVRKTRSKKSAKKCEK